MADNIDIANEALEYTQSVEKDVTEKDSFANFYVGDLSYNASNYYLIEPIIFMKKNESVILWRT